MKDFPEQLKWLVFADIKEFYLTGKLRLEQIAENHGLKKWEVQYLHGIMNYNFVSFEHDDNWLYQNRIMEAEKIGGVYKMLK